MMKRNIFLIAILLPGEHKYIFEANNLPSGVYIYRMTAGEFSQVKRLVLLK